MKQVIFNADDFGLDLAVNEAVEIANKAGLLTSASLMVGEAAATDAIDRARLLPNLRVGLHVVLIDGTPVSPPKEIPDLVGRDGRLSVEMVGSGFKFFFKPGVRRQIAREIRAQFEAFARSGLKIDHVNAHKHVHLHPTVAELIMRIGREYGVRTIRIPSEPWKTLAAAGVRHGRLGAIALDLWCGQLRSAAQRAGYRTNDYVFGIAWSGEVTEERLLKLIPELPDGVSEIYLHPASRRTPLLERLMPTYRHEAEFRALLSPRVRAQLAAAGIGRTTYGALAA